MIYIKISFKVIIDSKLRNMKKIKKILNKYSNIINNRKKKLYQKIQWYQIIIYQMKVWEIKKDTNNDKLINNSLKNFKN